ncbi:hypothetical protein LEN26_016613 [Aphanomyces euteiches]|nr:hypothetical protein LEN26_016613 [Aphanomyces euteiches]
MFAFLKVLRPYNVLGSLEHLSRLSLTHKVWDLWPWLHLNPSILGSAEQSSYEAITKYYDKVVVEPYWNDVEWLKAHLIPKTKVAWEIKDFPFTIEISDGWFDLNITQLTVSSKLKTDLSCKDLLPRLHHLTSLTVSSDSNDLGDLFELVAKSKYIVDFKIVAAYHRMTASGAFYLTKWFLEHPVRNFVWCLNDLGLTDTV